ncbi:MAG: hypothetical protein HQK49_04575 [Oligoflexia bacterium]|nr:hypothetical protein [Oligoflexia bacterium]
MNKLTDKLDSISLQYDIEYLSKIGTTMVNRFGKFVGTVVDKGYKVGIAFQKNFLSTYLKSDFKFNLNLNNLNSKTGRIKVKDLLLSEAEGSTAIDDNIKREFYMNLGKEIIELTKSDFKDDNLTIIDVSKFEMKDPREQKEQK